MAALRNRWVRAPSYLVGGFAAAAALAAWFHPHYLPLCNRLDARPGVECAPVTTQTMVGFFVMGLGFVSLVVLPVVASVAHLIRHGADWEMPRGTETTQTNLPILAGVIYLVTGTIVAVTGY